MPLQLREFGFHVENHATQWHGFQHEIQFQEIVVAWIQLTLLSMVKQCTLNRVRPGRAQIMGCQTAIQYDYLSTLRLCHLQI